MLKAWWEAFVELIYPPRCPGCRSVVSVHGEWCGVCLGPVLAVRSLSMAEHRLRYLDGCQVVCEYTGGVKKVIRALKFHGQRKYALHCRWLLDRSAVSLRLGPPDVVMPIPLYADRLRGRGYNQTSEIFKKWALANNWLWREDVLLRVRNTVPQWQLVLHERRKNMKDAFQVTRPELIKGKRILIVDDIFTAGVTMNEAARALKKAGAAQVTGLAIASGAQ